ncbi:MAG: hypothetical protein LIP10_03515 [Clostridiales bacterium]|nr:hypothetical protein [Clostridiales bacterium]
MATVAVTDSILTSVKKLLGIAEDYEYFDPDVIIHINSVFSVLNQLGVGPDEGFSISDSSAVWSDFIGTDSRLNDVVSYMHIKVRRMFDPPQSTAVLESYKELEKEYEWRLNVAVDPAEEVS